jgi:hypothetical protein
MYDLDGNNFLSRDELVHLIRNFFIVSKKGAVASEIEKKTEEILKNADIDLDKKLSFKEFQVK